jgi:Fe2+ transport system protein FeoA
MTDGMKTIAQETPMSLADLPAGQSATIVRIDGGRRMAERLFNLGITVGSTVTKVSGLRWGGPVTIVVGRMRIAVGFGMASRMIVGTKSK